MNKKTDVQRKLDAVELLRADLQAALTDLNESEQRLRTLFKCAPEAIVMLDVDTGRFVNVNPMAEELFGYSRATLLELGPFALGPKMQPDGSSTLRGAQRIAEAVRGDTPVFEWWHCNSRGERIPCEVRLVRMPWGVRDVLRGSVSDISERKLLELSESSRRRVLDSIAHGASLTETLACLVRTVESLLPGMICSVLLLDRKTQRLHLGAAPSLPDFFNAAVEGLEIGPSAGSCGAAAITGRRMIVTDLMQHPNWTEFRQLALRAELKACWSEPVISLSGNVLGTFAMYYQDPTEPSPLELNAIEVSAQLAGIVLEYEAARRSLNDLNKELENRVAEKTKHLSETNQRLRAAEQDARLAAVAFDTHDSIVITDKEGRILNINRSFTELTGYLPEEVIGKTPRILKSGRHGDVFYREMWHAIQTDGYWEGEVWNKRKDGRLFLQRLTIACLKNEAGETTHYVGDGQDVTAEKRAEADRAEIEAARTVQRTLFPDGRPGLAGFDIAGATFSAERVSGDFFDYVEFGPGRIGLLVADVSGHGLGPALLMAQTQAYLHALVESSSSPGELLTHANRLFAMNDSGHIVTMFLGLLDVEKQTLVHAAAGHQGYLFNAQGELTVLKATAMPIGVIDDLQIPSAQATRLMPDDMILLPTDGIEEARSRDDDLFSRQRMLEVARMHREAKAADIIDSLYLASRDFSDDRPQDDDITAVVVKVNK